MSDLLLTLQLCALDFKEENLARGPPLPFKQRWAERFWRLRHPRSQRDDDEEDGEEEDTGDRASQHSYRREDVETANSNQTLAPPRIEGERREGKDDQEKQASLAAAQKEKENCAVEDSDNEDEGEGKEQPGELRLRQQRSVRYAGAPIYRKTSRHSSFTSMLESTRPIPPTAPLDATDMANPCRPIVSRTSTGGNGEQLIPVCSNHNPEPTYHEPVTPEPSIHKLTIFGRLIKLVKLFMLPNTVAIVLAIPCAIIAPLKALFVDTSGWTGGRMPNAPDGNPPLHFIMETASFIGGIAVPASLLLLGASMARLKVGVYQALCKAKL